MMSPFQLIFLASLLGLFSSGRPISAVNESRRKLADSDPSCPLNVAGHQKMLKGCCKFEEFLDVSTECRSILHGFWQIRSDYLRTTGRFIVPPNASQACWTSLQSPVTERLGSFDVRSNCSVPTSWLSNDCSKVTTRSEFEALIPKSELRNVSLLCNQSLRNSSLCGPCTSSVLSIQEAYFNGPQAEEGGLVGDCAGYAFMYAAAFANQPGPFDYGTTKCLFSLDISDSMSNGNRKMMIRVAVGCAVGLLSVVVGIVLFLRVRWLKHWRKKRRRDSSKGASITESGLGFLGERACLVKYTFEEMKEATGNFSRENLIGKGGYGNVFRGVLANGSEVALKRFKNCSASGDVNFAHEIEAIASVKHINLINLRGYCIATDFAGNHQRIIVCDLEHNGSLHDHLFGSRSSNKLTWPVRKNIALGTARGLAYLHNGAQPTIIHRDVKASNILLDEAFEPKLADFGLAKFTPDGLSHLSTRVAGTLGYVAPEYAMYGQLTERSDVYSFGVVLLQLLSGKEAVVSVENGEALLLTDWAWSLVMKGQTLDVIEEDMPGVEMAGVMERYVLVAVLSAHPLLHARPSMEQIVKILENEVAGVPSIPNYPMSAQSTEDLESSTTSSGLDLSSTFQLSSILKGGCSSLDSLEV